jgi:hypothetical protein
MRKLAVLSAVVLALVVVAAAIAAANVTYNDSVSVGKPVSVTVKTYGPTAFKVLLRVQTQGRTQLFLTGKHAPKGGALIDTNTFACDGAAGSYYCKASYEALPAGTYTWRIVRVAGPKENTTLTLRW